MEKRLVPFLILSTLILVGSLWLQRVFYPTPPEQGAGEVVDAENGADEQNAEAGDDSGELPAEGEAPAESGDNETGDAPLPAETTEGEQEVVVPAEGSRLSVSADEPLQHFTLGSLDEHADPHYRMLVTLVNRGGAVERIELTSPRYRDLEAVGGYLGNLALSDASDDGGAVIGVVGAGTPAAKANSNDETAGAGLQVGDIITRLAGEPVAQASDVARILENTKPKQEVEIEVRRTAGDAARTLTYSTQLASTPFQLLRPEKEIRPAADDFDMSSFLITLATVGDSEAPPEGEIADIASCYENNWIGKYVDTPEGRAVEFTLPLAQQGEDGQSQVVVELVRRYRLAHVEETAEGEEEVAPAYHLVMELELRNLSSAPLKLAYRMLGPTGLPLEGWWYAYKVHPSKWGTAGIRDVFYRSDGGSYHLIRVGDVLSQEEEAEEEGVSRLVNLRQDEGDSERLEYVGMDNQYFCVALLPDPPEGAGAPAGYDFSRAMAMLLAEEDPLRGTRSSVTFQLDSEARDVAPGESISQRYRIYAGPKSRPLMSAYDLDSVIVYGWFGVVARPMQSILHFLYGIVHNYGLAIILLTVMVRGALFPLGRKVALNARKMQELAPQMKALAEKYKDDMQKRADAQRELFRANNYNPFGGCLLMFLQLPIFIGLYRALSVDIELRQAPLIPGVHWASNLAGPDHLFRWDSFMGQLPVIGGMFQEGGMLGPYFNLLPVFTVILFLVQQKMFTPPPTDEQQRIQQKMMSFMTIFIGVMFFKVPAGLCLYFIASSLWGIGERKLLPKSNAPAPAAESTPALGTTSKASQPSQSEQRKRVKGKSKRR